MGGGKRKARKAAASGGVAAARAPAAAEGTVYKRGTPVLVKAKPQDGWKSGVVIGTTNRGKPLVTLEGAELGIVWNFIKVREATPESTPPTSAAGGSPPGSTARSASGGTGETETAGKAHTDPIGAAPDPPAVLPLAQPLMLAPAPDGGAEAEQGQEPERSDSGVDHSDDPKHDDTAAIAVLTTAAVGAEVVRARLAADPEFTAAAEALRSTKHHMHAHLVQVYSEANERFAKLEQERRKNIDEEQEVIRKRAWDDGLRHAQAAMLSRTQGGGAANPPPAAAAAGGGAAAAAGAPFDRDSVDPTR